MQSHDIIVVTGQRGMGKSTYLFNHIYDQDRIIVFDLLGEFTFLETVYTLKDFFKLLRKRQKDSFFQINYYNPKTSDSDFHIICETVNRLESVQFVVDEIDYFCSAVSIPQHLSEIIKRGRHQNLGMMAATRRPHEIPRLITSQLAQFVTFRHIEPRDLDYIKVTCGLDPEEIKKLEKYHYMKFTEEGIERGITSNKGGLSSSP